MENKKYLKSILKTEQFVDDEKISFDSKFVKHRDGTISLTLKNFSRNKIDKIDKKEDDNNVS